MDINTGMWFSPVLWGSSACYAWELLKASSPGGGLPTLVAGCQDTPRGAVFPLAVAARGMGGPFASLSPMRFRGSA